MNGYLLMNMSEGRIVEYTRGEMEELFGKDELRGFIEGHKPVLVLDKKKLAGGRAESDLLYLDVRYACNFFLAANKDTKGNREEWLKAAIAETQNDRAMGRK